VPTLTEAISNFDGISYAKGGSVLKQLDRPYRGPRPALALLPPG
jgi:hypothetical protein